jgi:hypothetical protein
MSRLVSMEATSSFPMVREILRQHRSCASGWKDGRRPRSRVRVEQAERPCSEKKHLLRVAACVLKARVGTVASAWSYGEETAGLAGMPVEMVVRLGAVRKPFLHFPFHLIFVFISRQTNEEGPSIHSRFPDAPSNGAGHAQTPTRILPPRQPRPSLHLDNDKKSRRCWLKKTTTTPLLSHWDSLSFTSQPREKELRDIPK